MIVKVNTEQSLCVCLNIQKLWSHQDTIFMFVYCAFSVSWLSEFCMCIGDIYYLAPLLNFACFLSSIFNYKTWGRFTLALLFSLEMFNVWVPSTALFNCVVCWNHCGFPFESYRIKNVSQVKTSDCNVYSSENPADRLPDTGNQT